MTLSSTRTKLYVGRTLREGPKLLAALAEFFHRSGYTVYMPYDDDTQNSPREIKKRDMEAMRSSDIVVLELEEPSLGVAQELGAARALGKPVILISTRPQVISHNWVRGDEGVKCCDTKEEALELLKFYPVESPAES